MIQRGSIYAREIGDKKVLLLKELLEKEYNLEVTLVEYLESEFSLEQEQMHFLYLEDNDIKNFLKECINQEVELYLLPHPKSPNTTLRYGLSKDIKKALSESFEANLRLNDEMLFCNEEMVFQKVSIGNVQNLNKQIYETSFFTNLKIFFSSLKNLKYKAIKLKTKNSEEMQTIASGILILEDYTFFSTLKGNETSSFHDGKLNAFIIAPYSIASYLYYLVAIFLYHKFSIGKLPQNIGFIVTKLLHVKSSGAFHFSIDEVPMSAQEIVLEVKKCSYTINYGKSFQKIIEEKTTKNEDESINLKSLPKGEMRDLLVAGKVPLFKKASDEDIKDTLIGIRENAKINPIFITLMVLSSLLATVGIYQDSIPSVVGAMILAPLMAPIISLAMGAARSDRKIIKASMITLGTGVLSALFFSSVLTFFMPLDIVTSQISSRINPNILDLFVAIFSGIAGAYASAKEEVAKSLAGVAIAVALVPPLCVSGIGIGWGDFEIIYGSFLLFMTNLFGMVVAATLTFIFLGFAPVFRAKKSLLYSSLMLSVICIPLVFSFYSLILQNNDYEKLQNIKHFTFEDKVATLNVLNIKSSTEKSVVIEAEIVAATSLSTKEYAQIKNQLEKKMGKNVSLHVIPKIVIE
ncbi:MAG TPA: TIGR00341 family protein [Sulfurospirillum sp. UBA12182]|jgi:uncharacterized hydrophobic protein (TIGR00271 family)|nr:MAG TPA: TIGR00341 family protein [Sulfurospirillum sp. UBA12182]